MEVTFLTNKDKAILDGRISQLSEGIANANAINDGAISPPKTNFFETMNVKSSNLFDATKLIMNKYVTTTGGISTADSDTYCITDYIPVRYGDTLRLQAAFNETDRRFDLETNPSYGILYRVALYDADKNFIPGTFVNSCQTVSVTAENAHFCRITLTRQIIGWVNVMILNSASPSIVPYKPYFEPYTVYKLKKEHTFTEQTTAFIPSEICVAEGRTIELYKNQILPNAEKYHFKVDSIYNGMTRGRNFQRKISFKGENGWCENRGKAPVGVSIYNDDMDIVWSGNTTIRYATLLSTPKTICCIGDSLTNGKAWLAEIVNLSGGNLTLVGTRQFNVADADGTMRTGGHEGRSGWTAAQYNQPGSDTPDDATFQYTNPFYNTNEGHFDWSYYVTNSLGGVSPDAVMLWLGTNGIALDPTENATAIKTLVDYIRADDANIPIFLAYTIYPGNQDAIGAQTSSDGYAAKSGAWRYEEYKKVLNLCIKLTEMMRDYENLHFIPLATCHDSEYNFGAVETPVNPRAAQTENMPIEAVHPQAQGYYQIADIVISSLSVHLVD